jgi:hypothetical protein
MKPDYWRRLVQSARWPDVEVPAEMPFGFDTRVLAAWRAERTNVESSVLLLLVRRALGWAAMVVVACALLNCRIASDSQANEVVYADLAVRWSLNP